MKYKYQMHMHTASCSKCGKATYEEYAQALLLGGYQGGVITNHFWHGNTAIDRSLPWAQFVEPYVIDWEYGHKIFEQAGLDLIFCVEEGIGQAREILPYGLEPGMLLAHPELADGLLKTWRKVADMCGFLLIQAHPFRKREYIPDGNQMPQGELLDGIEVFNSCNTPQDNEQAQAWSKQHPGKILTAGADAHAREIVCVSGMEVERRIQNERALAEILRTGSFRLLET